MFRSVPTVPSSAAGLAAVLLAGVVAAPSARADLAGDAVCGERAAVVKRLRDAYGETRRGYGLQRGASVIEVYASAETGSWTILVTTPDGVACLVAAGQSWAPTPEDARAELETPA
ncbi:MAG TPA: hypothetical protein VJ994_03300 [Paracoccaceae bacterium]|nr:hypothetical protein [Paracoccaceae bacterium]